MEFEFLSLERMYELSLRLAEEVRRSGFRPDVLLALGRGGLVPGRLLSDFLDIRELYVASVAFYRGVREPGERPSIKHMPREELAGRHVLLVDDVADSGETLVEALEQVRGAGAKEVRTATLYYKPWSRFKPDYYVATTSAWVIFPWERLEVLKDVFRKEGERGLSKLGYPRELLERLRALLDEGLEGEAA